MGLLANLGLKAKPATPADAGIAKADALKAELGKDIKAAVALAGSLPDPKAKADLAKALAAADADGRKAAALSDANARALALQAVRDKISAASSEAKKGVDAKPSDKPAGPLDAQPAPQGSAAGAKKADTEATDAKAEAAKLRPQLEKQQAEAREAYAKLRPAQAKLEDQIEAAKADKSKAAELADLQAKKKAIDLQMAPIDRQIKQLDADAKALDDPRSNAKTYNEILARQKAGVGVVKTVEVDDHDLESGKKLSERKDAAKKLTQFKETKVESEVADGKATSTTTVTSGKIGLDGATTSKSKTTEVVGPDGKVTDSTSSTKTIGKDGLAVDKSTKVEREDKDGKKTSAEEKTAVKVGPGGASHSKTETVVKDDNSSTSKTKTTAVERGDGKLGVGTTATNTKTDASGNSTTTTSKTKGGVIAGKDGIGAFADKEGSIEKKSASGMKTGAVAGLNANIVCNVVPVKGSEPPSYEVVVSINLGMRLGASAGKDKEGAATKGSVSVSGSEQVTMNCRHLMSEAEAKAYTEGLKTGTGTQKEFAIIKAGLGQGWDAAREMYLAMSGKAMDKAEVDKLKKGESIEVQKSQKLGGAVDVGGKSGGGVGIGVSGGYEVGHDQSMKVTKEKDDKLTYDTKDTESDKLSGGVKVSVGVVEGGFSASRTNTTSTGYKISVDPKDAKAAEMQNALAKCKSQADLDAFAAKYPQSVQEKTKKKGTADAQGATVGVGGVKAGIGFGNSVDEAVTTDKDGKVKKRVTTGANTGGIEFGAGKLKIGASTKEEAVAEVDAEGNATLDVTKTDKDTNAAKWLGANVPGMGDKKDPKDEKGALTKAAGGETPPDTDDHDLRGIKLKGSDLGYLGHLACNDWGKWMGACPSPSMRADWTKAGKAIKSAGGSQAAVAQEIAKFVGADSGKRAEVVSRITRPAGDVSSGSRYEFPGTLASRKGEYDSLVIADCEKQLDALKEDKPKLETTASGLLSQLDRLYATVGSASGFQQPAVQAEMLAAISSRKDKIQTKLRVLKGGKADELSGKEKLDKYNEILGNCIRFQNTETDCFAKIEASYKDGKPGLDATIENAKLVKQVRDLHALWQPQYDEMAALSQENGFGADRYWKYKPDRDRFNRAVKEGKPGAATQAKPETEDKRKKAPVKVESADPLGDSKRELEKKRETATQGIEAQLPAAKNKAYGAANRLFAWFQTDKKAAAGDAHNRGMKKLKSADANAAKVKPGNKEDLEAYGYIAIEDYQAAAKIFAEGLAGYPSGMPKKEKKEASA